MIYNTQQEAYYVYIILCNDESYYTGLTDDLMRRFEEHTSGFYETCYTFKRRPLVLKYYETIPFLKDAVDREIQIKGWSKAKKKAKKRIPRRHPLLKSELLAQVQKDF